MRTLSSFLCPICRCKGFDPMYPKAVCFKCINKYGTKTADGTDISFINSESWDGITAICNNETYNCSTCYINHIKVFATSPIFGGIVFQPVE